MKIIDLSHTIHQGMPVFPGTEQPVLHQTSSIEKNGFAERKITLFSHVGTHLDAPAHILKDTADLSTLPIEQFFGKAICIKISESSRHIDTETLSPFADMLPKLSFVLFSTGWEKYWGDARYFSGYPTLSENAAMTLCRYSLKGVGFDTISADKEDSTSLPIHRILLQHMIIIENLNNLKPLGSGAFLLSCLPLKIEHGDGSPIRAAAILQ